jgi:hypothetical protein
MKGDSMKATSAIVVTVGLLLSGVTAQAGTQFDQTTVETSVISCEAKLEGQYKKNAKLQCEVEYLECLAAGKSVFVCKYAEQLCKLESVQAGLKLDGGAGDDFTNKEDPEPDGDGLTYEADGTSGTSTLPSEINGDLIIGNFKLKPGKKLIENGGIEFNLDDDGTVHIKVDQIIRTVSCEALLEGAKEHFQSLQEKIEDLKTSGEGR